MSNPTHRYAAAIFALLSGAPCALGDIVYLSKEWTATGSGSLVDPGFPDMSGSFSEMDDESAPFLRPVLTLRNYPDFSSAHNWLRQNIIAEMDPIVDLTELHLQLRVASNLTGLGAAITGESTMTLRATVLVTGEPEFFSYSVHTAGEGFAPGVCERTARLVLRPSGQAPILDEMVRSTFDDGDTRESTSFLTLSPGTYDILFELRYDLDQADVSGRFDNIAMAKIAWRVPAPGTPLLLSLASLATLRRKR